MYGNLLFRFPFLKYRFFSIILLREDTSTKRQAVKDFSSEPSRNEILRGGTAPESRQSAKLFLKSSELGLPHPLTRPPVLGGGLHSRAREGLGESQFRPGDIHCGTLYINVLYITAGFGDVGS
jgi:hypothetical protein